MIRDQVELAVVGAGPAGLEAALAAAEAGVSVLLIDGYARPGGQYLKQLPAAFRETGRAYPHPEVQALLHRLAGADDIRLLSDTVVWGIFPAEATGDWLLALSGPEDSRQVRASVVILATGAYDRPVAFPGWSLPGVLTAGAAQTLLKNQRVLPGRRILLSGSGPLQLAVAAQLVRAGAEVIGMLEAATLDWRRGLHYAPAVWRQWSRLAEGWGYWRTLRRAGTPLRFGWAVIEARGEGQVEAGVIARLDDNGQPRPGTARTVAVDTIITGYGFIPATQLSRLAGCRHTYRPEQGGYVPDRDERLQTSCPGLYSVGDGAGIGGAQLARIEGRVAGLAAAVRLGHLPEAAGAQVIAGQQPALVRERRFAGLLHDLFAPRPGLFGLATDDTIICRCEEVRLADIRQAIRDGAVCASAVKGITRAGMGNCQGRICAELVARAIAAETTEPGDYAGRLAAAGAFTARSPIFPLPLATLAEAADVA